MMMMMMIFPTMMLFVVQFYRHYAGAAVIGDGWFAPPLIDVMLKGRVSF